jgi:DNA-binding beta-propeller fold protein YncE
LAVSYSGNNGKEYGLVFHLVRGWKLHLEYLQTIAAKGSPSDSKVMNELPCTFRVFAGGTEGTADGSGVTAQFKNPSGLAIDATGNVYVADRTNQTLRRIRPTGETETMAGVAGEHGTADGPGKAARFWYPQGLAIDEHRNVYVADTSSKCVRKVTSDGQVSTLASGFKYPTAVAVNHDGEVFVTDSSNHVIQKITHDGKVSVVAGKAGESGSKNGHGEDARFHFPCGIAVGADGALYVVEHYAIRKIDGKGNVTTLAGSLEEEGRNDGTGTAARFWGLTAIVADSKGNLYVADHEVKNLRRISRSGVVQTIRTTEHGDLPLQNPMALAVDAEGRIFVADQNDSTILLVEPISARETTAK